jgi:hypothetical protein
VWPKSYLLMPFPCGLPPLWSKVKGLSLLCPDQRSLTGHYGAPVLGGTTSHSRSILRSPCCPGVLQMLTGRVLGPALSHSHTQSTTRCLFIEYLPWVWAQRKEQDRRAPLHHGTYEPSVFPVPSLSAKRTNQAIIALRELCGSELDRSKGSLGEQVSSSKLRACHPVAQCGTMLVGWLLE